MKVASTCKALEVNVRLCFLVNVLKARGLKVAGGRMIGSMLAFAGIAAGLKGLIGCACGVPNAGEEEGMGFKGAGLSGTLNIEAAFGFSGLCIRDILKC